MHVICYFMRIMQIKCQSHEFVPHKLLSLYMLQCIECKLECILNKNRINLTKTVLMNLYQFVTHIYKIYNALRYLNFKLTIFFVNTTLKTNSNSAF